MRRGRRYALQGQLPFKSHGGPRRGAGRKPGPRPWVPRTSRPRLSRHHPVHVTVRLRDGLPSMRTVAADAAIRECFVKAQGRFGMRVVDYSIQHNHLHLIVEAADKPSLARGMQALQVRIARALNRHWERRGSIFADRYHAHVLEKPREVRNAIAYVINNARKHGHRPRSLDRFSSGPWFDGWKEHVVVRGLDVVRTPVAAPRTWLRTKGWRRHGLIRVAERPGERPDRRAKTAPPR